MATQWAPGEDTTIRWTIASYKLQSPATESNSLCKIKNLGHTRCFIGLL